jgi:hypothetical protein
VVAPFLRPGGDISPEEQRAAISSLAGGLRLPFGNSRPFNVIIKGQGAPIVSNKTQDAIIFVELRAISGQPAINFLVGPHSQLAPTSNPQFAFPGESPLRFLVYPSETLYIIGVSGVDSQILKTELRV